MTEVPRTTCGNASTRKDYLHVQKRVAWGVVPREYGACEPSTLTLTYRNAMSGIIYHVPIERAAAVPYESALEKGPVSRYQNEDLKFRERS